MKKSLKIIVGIVVMAFALASCTAPESPPEVPVVDDTNAVVPPAPVLPFAEAEDLTSYFTEENVEFSENVEKGALVCSKIKTSEYAQAIETVHLPSEDAATMIIHCTWTSAAKTMYIGFINETTDDVYVLSAVGGALTGTLDLGHLPDGEYSTVMYSDDNENVDAVMLYQFR